MGTTRIKVIDLSGEQQEIKTSRKHAEKLSGLAKIKKEKTAAEKVPQRQSVEEQQEAAVAPTPMEAEVAKIPKAVKPEPPLTSKPTHHRGKKYQEVAKVFDKSKAYTAQEALALLAKSSLTKFDPTVEIHLNVTDQNIRGSVNFPHAVGSKRPKRYLVFADQKPAAGKVSKAFALQKQIIWGTFQTIADIEAGKLKPDRDFDAVIASPKYMPSLAKIAKILGPQGLMPNPKAGTITDNPEGFIEKGESTGFEYKTDPTAPIIHTKIGKLSSKPEALSENFRALILAVGPGKIKKAIIKSTMSPAIKIDLTTIAAS